ncbi:MAG: 50S ribosomal protein L20 [Candidatus Cloacimonetes bacterium]|nr:50S ribosomal protein L20 [Candidatus Cloacimonadota bacterium]MCF7814593.1 50S ribosomal protein L20 [Candidatus Cloacimonadota bacterium]MCF7869073.1 50S ribosomal protein L20 [Candidatus Cloacimonadota bacterium]MCF7884490.1 50S ribosomal protein L20 [Candidatus Cloacimonadota bacterium]
MPRTTNNVAAKKRRKKYLKAAKGYVGGRSKLYRTARQAVEKGWQYAYRDRKAKKREFRKLWIIRINAAARMNDLTYSTLIHGLKKAEVEIDRKVLAHLAFHDMEAFTKLCDLAKNQK